MAKKFAGFTPAQLDRIFPELQGLRPQDKQTVLDSDRSMQDRLREMEMEAQRRISGREFAEGGLAETPQPEVETGFPTVQETLQRSDVITEQLLEDPTTAVTTADIAKTDITDSQVIDPTTGQVKAEDTPQVAVTDAVAAPAVTVPTPTPAAQVDATEISETVKSTLSALEAATGQVGEQALVAAAEMEPQELSALGLSVEQIAEARKVIAPEKREVEEGEMISGAAVDMTKVEQAVNFEAATGAPSSDATVQGQLTGLMEQFEGTEPPAWAAGAMRQAAARMAARGLSASSMAGQAIVQAAMESALPIAVQDAQTSATFERQNLSNKQQAAMFAAEKRAQFLNLEFTQDFQAKVQNAARISEIANMNFSAEQQVALENSRMAQSVDLANLSAANAKIMADAAAMSQVELTNLNNRQQAQVQNAKSFLQMDMANLSNEQQTAMFRMQSVTQALLSDQAAQNAAAQFNASSENQTNQFFASLQNQVSMFNTEQQNAIARFNAGEENALNRFNAEMRNQRDMFNAQNSLVIEQANTAWAQKVATAETAAINERNMEAARVANGFTNLGMNTVLQEARDIMSFAWDTANNDADRATRILLQQMVNDQADSESAARRSDSMFSTLGSLFANFLNPIG